MVIRLFSKRAKNDCIATGSYSQLAWPLSPVGEGVEKGQREAVIWTRKVVEQGDAASLVLLGSYLKESD
jgi:TPR repeat protein